MRKIRGLLKKKGHTLNSMKQNYLIGLFAKDFGLVIPKDKKLVEWAVELYISGELEELKRGSRQGLLSADWAKLCKRVYKEHINECVYCGAVDNLSVDHILPISIYPELGAEYSNLQILCRSCNSSKGNKIFSVVEDNSVRISK